MIGILDQIEVPAIHLAALQQLFAAQYLPGAQLRGMQLARSWVSPPLNRPETPNTLWLLWELADIGAWWRMRATAGASGDIPLFWTAVDKLCVRRERHYLQSAALNAQDAALAAIELPGPLPLGTERIINAQGARETAQIFLRARIEPHELERWQQALQSAPQHVDGLRQVFLARNLEGSFGAGDFTCDLHFDNEDALRDHRRQAHWSTVLQPLFDRIVEREWRMGTQLIGGGLRDADVHDAIKRTAYFKLLPNAPEDAARALEHDLLQMPAYMAGMTNWSLSRALGSDWTYVWEQEYLHLGDLLGEYMIHPHHWAHVDSWFDPEFSRQIVDTRLSHAFCAASRSVLAWSLRAG